MPAVLDKFFFGVSVLSDGADNGLVMRFWSALVPTIENAGLVFSVEVAVFELNIDVGVCEAGLLTPPKIENVSLFTGSTSSVSSIDSLGDRLPLRGVDTISSKELPNENAPEEGLSAFGKSLTAEPSPLKLDFSSKPPWAAPKGFLTSLEAGGGNEV